MNQQFHNMLKLDSICKIIRRTHAFLSFFGFIFFFLRTTNDCKYIEQPANEVGGDALKMAQVQKTRISQ